MNTTKAQIFLMAKGRQVTLTSRMDVAALDGSEGANTTDPVRFTRVLRKLAAKLQGRTAMTITARDKTPAGNTPMRFLRLKVSQP